VCLVVCGVVCLCVLGLVVCVFFFFFFFFLVIELVII